jgi:hypothetical protein
VNHHVRPERPDVDEAPHITDEIWRLAEHCWASDPLSRPSGSAVCDDIRCILDRRTSSQAASEPKPKAREISPDHQHIDNEPQEFGEVPWNDLFNNSVSSLSSINSSSHHYPKTNSTPSRNTSCTRDAKPISHNTAYISSTSARPSSAPRSSSGSSTCDAQPTTQSASEVATPSFLDYVGKQPADDSTHSRSSCGSSTSDAQLTTQSAPEVATSSFLNNVARYTADDSTPSRSSGGSSARDAQSATQLASEVANPSVLSSIARHTPDSSTLERAYSIALDSNTEPGPEWKLALRKGIEECLFPLYTDAREILDQKLNEAPIHDEVARERARKEYDSAYKNICHIADILYREETESERQQLRWLVGRTVDPDWFEGIVRYRKAIIEKSQAMGKHQ